MKRLLNILAWLILPVSGCPAQERCSVGTDLCPLICQGTVRMTASYAFSRKCTADGEVGMNVGGYIKHSQEEKGHWGLLYGKYAPSDSVSFRSCFADACISFSYWPSAVFEGFSTSLGLSVRDRGGPDLDIGAGYSCKIWKGIRLNVGYRFRTAESIRNRKLPLEGFRIIVSYVF